MNKIIRNDAIVIGANHHNTLGVVRSLGEKGIKSIIIIYNTKKTFIKKSKYVKDIYTISEVGNLITLLLSIKDYYNGKIVLIAVRMLYHKK